MEPLTQQRTAVAAATETSPLAGLNPSGSPAPAPPDDVLLERSRRRRNVQAPVMFAVVASAVAVMFVRTGVGLSLYGAVAIAYLAVKLGLAIRYRPASGDPDRVGSVAAVVPFYNEDPATLAACLESILGQSRPVARIYVIDDGSTTDAALRVAHRVLSASGHPGAVIHRLEHNQGKRHAQAWAFRRLDTDLVLTVDSDTILHSHAVHEAARGFDNPAVQGVTGNVQAHNAGTNLLTRLTSLRYANAFLWERAAYSAVGSVLCACGSLSLWRRSLI